MSLKSIEDHYLTGYMIPYIILNEIEEKSGCTTKICIESEIDLLCISKKVKQQVKHLFYVDKECRKKIEEHNEKLSSLYFHFKDEEVETRACCEDMQYYIDKSNLSIENGVVSIKGDMCYPFKYCPFCKARLYIDIDFEIITKEELEKKSIHDRIFIRMLESMRITVNGDEVR